MSPPTGTQSASICCRSTSRCGRCLREMRPFFAKSLPAILARFYDKVRHYDPSSGIFKDGMMQEAIRLQLHHWDLIATGDFGTDYLNS